MYKFWMVWNPNGNSPLHRHDTEASARKEAERLCQMDKGYAPEGFIVLEAIGTVIKQQPPVSWERAELTPLCDDEIPL